MTCGAARAVRCCCVLRCAFFRTHNTGYHAKYQVPACTCVLVFLLFSVIVPPVSSPHVPPPPAKLHPYCGSERDIANKRSTAQGFQLYTISSWHCQTASCTESWALLSALFTFNCIFPRAIVAGGVSRRRSGALVVKLQLSCWTSSRRNLYALYCFMVKGA